MFQFRACPSRQNRDSTNYGGFPHSDTAGSKLLGSSPTTFAATCVLLRPMHPLGIHCLPYGSIKNTALLLYFLHFSRSNRYFGCQSRSRTKRDRDCQPNQWTRADSNRLPLRCKRSVLPGELRALSQLRLRSLKF